MTPRLTFEKTTCGCLPVWRVSPLFRELPLTGDNITGAVSWHGVTHIRCHRTVLGHDLTDLTPSIVIYLEATNVMLIIRYDKRMSANHL